MTHDTTSGFGATGHPDAGSNTPADRTVPEAPGPPAARPDPGEVM
ncbi:hypothetical protein [Streptomyces sp. NBC_00199]|nr:hypothetical protein [Streptomyces sp. NBC_00199]MCX5265513.1 hypothetical protein [Streptomyces sp. NBC_00199]